MLFYTQSEMCNLLNLVCVAVFGHSRLQLRILHVAVLWNNRLRAGCVYTMFLTVAIAVVLL